MTYYRIPIVKGTSECQNYIINDINRQREQKWWNNDCEEEALVLLKSIDFLDKNISDELLDTICDFYTLIFINNEPRIFISADGFNIGEPRLGGYSETIIQSVTEMFDAMKQGLIDPEGEHIKFCDYKKQETFIKDNIIRFFDFHPDGIIMFG